MAMQLVIFYWSLVAWLMYVNLKSWIENVFDVVTFVKVCLSAKVFYYAMCFNVDRTSHSKIIHCDALIIFAMPSCILGKELFLFR